VITWQEKSLATEHLKTQLEESNLIIQQLKSEELRWKDTEKEITHLKGIIIIIIKVDPHFINMKR
jgi:hypothetical protein